MFAGRVGGDDPLGIVPPLAWSGDGVNRDLNNQEHLAGTLRMRLESEDLAFGDGGEDHLEGETAGFHAALGFISRHELHA